MKIPPEALRSVGLDPSKPHTAVDFFAALAQQHATLAPRLALADEVLRHLGESDPVRAKGVAGGKLARLATLEAEGAKLRRESDASARERRWEKLVEDGAVKMAQAFSRIDGPDGKPARVYAAWAEAQNKAYPELASFEGWADSLPKGAHVNEQGVQPGSPPTLGPVAKLSARAILNARRSGLTTDNDLSVLAAVVARQQRGPQAAEGI